MFKVTAAIRKMRRMKRRKKVVQGGTSAGKTYGIIPILIDKCCKKKRRVTVVAETLGAVKKGAVEIFKTVMQDTGRWFEERWFSGSPMEYRFDNGSVMEFTAFDSVGKAKAAGKRDILFINEANHIEFEIADILMTRSREVWLDFNADIEFWAHTEVLADKENAELLILTYEDNSMLPEETRSELMFKRSLAYYDVNGDLESADNIKSKHWHNWWRVFGRGLIGNASELRIMPMLSKATEVPMNAIEIPSALDFGWFPDPTAFARLFIIPGEKGKSLDRLYILPLVYEVRLSTNSKAEDSINLVDVLIQKGVNKRHLIIAESAEPGTVDEIRRSGFNIEAVVKTAVETSIRLFHDYEIYIVGNATNKAEAEACWEEFDKYQYKMDKVTGKVVKIPREKQADHFIDGVRYILMSKGGRWEMPRQKAEQKKAA